MGNVYKITGRAVQGDVYKMTQRIDDKTKQPKVRADGQPSMQHYIALAVPKNDPALAALLAQLDAEHKAFWPGGQWQLPTFASKVEDGDSTVMNKKMKRNCDREGFPGNMIFKFTNGYAPRVQYWDPQTGWTDSVPGSGMGPAMKIGDYYTIIFDVETNKSTDSPGVHLNTKTIAYEGPGTAITSEADYSEMLGTRGPGGNATVTAPAVGHPAPPPVVSPPPAPIASPSSPPPPYAGYMAPPPVPAAPPPVPAGPVMLPAANGVPYESYIARGWTDEQLRANGMMQ